MAMFNFQDSNSVAIKEYVKQNLPFLAIEYDGRRASIRRNPNYQETVNSVKKAFGPLRQMPNDSIALCAPLLEINDILQVTEELWSDMLPRLMLVKIVLDQASRPERTPAGMQIHTKTQMGKLTTFNVTPQTTIGELKEMIHEKEGVLVGDQRLGLNGQELLYDHWSLATCGIYHDATLNLACALRFGKPVIYLYPPTPLADIQVQLSLVRAWEFSALYPPVAISNITSSALGQTVSWQVDAKPDGLLFDRSTRREVTYLFWEAHSHAAPKSLPSPASSRPATPAGSNSEPALLFDPARPVVNPNNSVLLPFDKVVGYIDHVLLALGLHTEARTSFITYWLPDLQKHGLIALRFLPQTEYEAAAPLDITPNPEVVTRVFMLFRGIDQSEAELWKNAVDRANVDVRNWRQVVGVDVERATDASLFRVLEWGGVEVV